MRKLQKCIFPQMAMRVYAQLLSVAGLLTALFAASQGQEFMYNFPAAVGPFGHFAVVPEDPASDENAAQSYSIYTAGSDKNSPNELKMIAVRFNNKLWRWYDMEFFIAVEFEILSAKTGKRLFNGETYSVEFSIGTNGSDMHARIPVAAMKNIGVKCRSDKLAFDLRDLKNDKLVSLRQVCGADMATKATNTTSSTFYDIFNATIWKVDYTIEDLMFGPQCYIDYCADVPEFQQKAGLLSTSYDDICDPGGPRNATWAVETLSLYKVNVMRIYFKRSKIEATDKYTKQASVYAFNYWPNRPKAVPDLLSKEKNNDQFLPGYDTICGSAVNNKKVVCKYVFTCYDVYYHCGYDCRPVDSLERWFHCSERYNKFLYDFPASQLSHLKLTRKVFFYGNKKPRQDLVFRCPYYEANLWTPVSWRILQSAVNREQFVLWEPQKESSLLVRSIELQQTERVEWKLMEWLATSLAGFREVIAKDQANQPAIRCGLTQEKRVGYSNWAKMREQFFPLMNYYLVSQNDLPQRPLDWCILLVDGVPLDSSDDGKHIFFRDITVDHTVSVICQPGQCYESFGAYYDILPTVKTNVFKPNFEVQWFGKSIFRTNHLHHLRQKNFVFQNEMPRGLEVDVPRAKIEEKCRVRINIQFWRAGRYLPQNSQYPSGVYTIAMFDSDNPSNIMPVYEFQVKATGFVDNGIDFEPMGNIFPEGPIESFTTRMTPATKTAPWSDDDDEGAVMPTQRPAISTAFDSSKQTTSPPWWPSDHFESLSSSALF